MPICTPLRLVQQAGSKSQIVPGFNVGNMEMVRGVVQAAEESNTAVILQIAEKRLAASPLHLLAPMMVSAARSAKVEVAVMLDHGESVSVIKEALDYGFSGIMFDGSGLPLNENIRKTMEIKELARQYGAVVEGEIGVLAGSEGGPEMEALYTSVPEAVLFAQSNCCDMLAVSIGNAHGHYKGKPKLNFDILREISNQVETPLVLHGGSGIPLEDFAKAAQMGIRKVNIATANFDALTKGARETFDSNLNADYFTLSETMTDYVRKNTLRHIEMFTKFQ